MPSNKSRLLALEARMAKAAESPTAADVAIAAAIEMLVESHGHLVDRSYIDDMHAANHPAALMSAQAVAALRFVEAVETVAPEAAAEFWRTSDFYASLDDGQ